jgi:hypothetical protein
MDSSMKTLELDGESKIFDGSKTFATVSEEIRMALPPERVLAEIYVDDKPIDLAEEEMLNEKILNDLGRVVVKSRRIDELFKESLQSAPHICQVLQQDCIDVEGFLSKNDFESTHERVIEMTALLEWLIQLVIGTQSLGTTNVDAATFEKQKVSESITRMQYQLVQLHFYLGSQNWEEFKKILTGSFRSELSVWEAFFSEASMTWIPQPSTLES